MQLEYSLSSSALVNRARTLKPAPVKSVRGQARHRLGECALGKETDLLTVEDVIGIAKAKKLHLAVKCFGPLYTIDCREGSGGGKVLGTTSGFIVPFTGLMHCDTMQVHTRESRGWEGARQSGGLYGLGYLLATAVFALGHQRGCHKAEILAINDNDYAHTRLKRYYTRLFGFQAVREVDGKFSDLPHLLVWGGIGTRMDGDIQAMLERCSLTYRRSLQSKANGGGQS